MLVFLGLLAGALTTLAPLLQAIKTLRTKETQGLSLGMWVAQSGGGIFWLIYGGMMKDIPILVANGLTLLCALVILAQVVRQILGRAGP